MKVKVSIDNEPFTKKPSGRQIGMIKKRMEWCWREMDLEELADLNGNRGHTITPAHLEGGVSAKNCTAMQLFVLDFDDGYTFAELKRKCDAIGLKITYAYHTFSSTEEKEKFRAVFVCEELVEDKFIIETVLKMLDKIFPECDHSCKNPDRMFFGGKGLFYFDESARLALVQLTPPLLESFDKGKHFAERMKEFAGSARVLFLNGHLAMGKMEDKDMIIGEKMDSAVIHITGQSTNSPFFIAERTREALYQCKTCQKEKVRKIDIWGGNTPCRLYNDFREGKWLAHDKRFCIFTNLMYINGGRKYFLELTREIYGEGTCGEWEKRQKYYKGYHPQRCSPECCPYFAGCENNGTIIATMEMDRKVYCGETEYARMDEAEECLWLNLQNAFRNIGNGMHLIKAQTGLGKTSMYVRLIAENPESRFLIALPTNSLKEEVGNSLICNGIAKESIFMTASVHGNPFIPPEIQARISEMHNRGIHNMTGEIIGDYYNRLKEEPYKRLEAEEECERILNGIKGVGEERVVVTTHAYLTQLQESFLKSFIVIIDEDFLQLQVFNRMHTVSMKCLKELEERGAQGYSGIVSEMLRSEEGIINYFCPLVLPDMKYIVLSATLNFEIYQHYFAGKRKIYTYLEKKAAYRGKLIQYTYHSLGRSDLADKKQVFDIARKMAGEPEVNIITFKKFEDEMEEVLNPAGIHFGNSTGINSLSGKNLAVIGTPYKVEEYYKLIACYLGEDVNREGDKRMVLRRVEYKGCSFLITTYKTPLLQEVQLYSIESELEQCVGRARLLRNDCSVYVFSCFPCEQAKIHMRDYLQEYDAGAGERPEKNK